MPLPKRTETAPRRLLGDEVFDRLYDAIADGSLAPGDILRDADLIKWLGVSRSPIRDALKRLSGLGLVELVPHRYTRVAPIDERHLIEVVNTMNVMYRLAIFTAVPQLTAEDRVLLEEFMEGARNAAKTEDRAALGPHLLGYYQVLAHRSGNERLNKSIDMMALQLRRVFVPREGQTDLMVLISRMEKMHSAVLAGERDAAVALFDALTEPNRREFLERTGRA